MAAKKNYAKTEVAILTQLNLDQYSECLKQFEEAHPGLRARKEFLGLSLGLDAGVLMLKVSVTQLGEAKFVSEMNLAEVFEAVFPGAKAHLKIAVKAAPILTSAAPKSAAGKKTAPVFPTKSSASQG